MIEKKSEEYERGSQSRLKFHISPYRINRDMQTKRPKETHVAIL